MLKLIIKSLAFGFIVGTIFMGLAPLGLGIAFVEFLKPVLVPGIILFRPYLQNTSGPLLWLLALIINGLIYTAFFLALILMREYIFNGKPKN